MNYIRSRCFGCMAEVSKFEPWSRAKLVRHKGGLFVSQYHVLLSLGDCSASNVTCNDLWFPLLEGILATPFVSCPCKRLDVSYYYSKQGGDARCWTCLADDVEELKKYRCESRYEKDRRLAHMLLLKIPESSHTPSAYLGPRADEFHNKTDTCLEKLCLHPHLRILEPPPYVESTYCVVKVGNVEKFFVLLHLTLPHRHQVASIVKNCDKMTSGAAADIYTGFGPLQPWKVCYPEGYFNSPSTCPIIDTWCGAVTCYVSKWEEVEVYQDGEKLTTLAFSKLDPTSTVRCVEAAVKNLDYLVCGDVLTVSVYQGEHLEVFANKGHDCVTVLSAVFWAFPYVNLLQSDGECIVIPALADGYGCLKRGMPEVGGKDFGCSSES